MRRLLIILIFIALCHGVAFCDATVFFLDVGQGDCAVILADDQVCIIDGGPSKASSKVYSFLEENGVKHIDIMVLSHGHSDHAGGLSGALNLATVGTVYSPHTNFRTKAFQDLKKFVEDQGKDFTSPAIGEPVPLGNGYITFLGSIFEYDETNNDSLILRFDYGSASFLFTGDAQKETEQDLVEAGADLQANVLKVAHHGSNTSSTEAFLEAVRPQYAVISCGSDKASPEVLLRLKETGSTILRTDESGEIVFVTDGKALNFRTANKV